MPAKPEILKYKVPKLALIAAALISLSIKAESEPHVVNAFGNNHPSLNSPIQTKTNNLQLELTHDEIIGPILKQKETPTTSTTTTPLTPQLIAENMVSPTMYAEWNKVHECEEPEVYNSAGQLISGGWNVQGSMYSGGLGISNENWVKYGGQYFAPSGNEADPKAQMIIASHIQSNPPDQNGCNPGGW